MFRILQPFIRVIFSRFEENQSDAFGRGGLTQTDSNFVFDEIAVRKKLFKRFAFVHVLNLTILWRSQTTGHVQVKNYYQALLYTFR